MSDITFVASDTGPSVSGTIIDSTNAPVNLTGATVKFQMRLLYERRFAVDAVAIIVNAAAGTVRYDWMAGDLALAGEYQSQWQVTYPGGVRETTDPPNTITIRAA